MKRFKQQMSDRLQPWNLREAKIQEYIDEAGNSAFPAFAIFQLAYLKIILSQLYFTLYLHRIGPGIVPAICSERI